jgi:hypothetical protein
VYQHRDNPPCVMHVCGAGSHERPSGEVLQMPYGATSTRGLGLSGVVVGSGIVEKPSADARRSEKRKTIIVLLVWNRRCSRQTKVFACSGCCCRVCVGVGKNRGCKTKRTPAKITTSQNMCMCMCLPCANSPATIRPGTEQYTHERNQWNEKLRSVRSKSKNKQIGLLTTGQVRWRRCSDRGRGRGPKWRWRQGRWRWRWWWRRRRRRSRPGSRWQHLWAADWLKRVRMILDWQ